MKNPVKLIVEVDLAELPELVLGLGKWIEMGLVRIEHPNASSRLDPRPITPTVAKSQSQWVATPRNRWPNKLNSDSIFAECVDAVYELTKYTSVTYADIKDECYQVYRRRFPRKASKRLKTLAGSQRANLKCQGFIEPVDA